MEEGVADMHTLARADQYKTWTSFYGMVKRNTKTFSKFCLLGSRILEGVFTHIKHHTV